MSAATSNRFSSPLLQTLKCIAESIVPILPIVKNAKIIQKYTQRILNNPNHSLKKIEKRLITKRVVASTMVQTSTLGALGLGIALAVGAIALNFFTLGLFAVCGALFLIGAATFYAMNRQLADMTSPN